MTPPLSPGPREQNATRVVFLVVGLITGSWAPLVPLAKSRVGLDEAGLGTLLLCIGLGSVVAMPFSGGLAARFGCRKVLLVMSLFALGALPLMATLSATLPLAVALACFGAGIGVMDVVMNIQAVIVERAAGRAMMSGFHGMFSVGGILGSAGVAGLLSFGLSPTFAVTSMAALGATSILLAAPGFLPYGGEESGPALAWPKGRVLLLGAMCFVLFLAEGSVLDWSGVLLMAERGLDKGRAGLGYAAFAGAMTLGRLFGDGFVRAVGPTRVILFGSLCAAIGFALAAYAPWWPVSISGFVLVGLGASNVVPVTFSAAGRQPSMPSHLAIAAVTTMGYAGILAGPAAIGFLARATTLSAALLSVSALLAMVAGGAKKATQVSA